MILSDADIRKAILSGHVKIEPDPSTALGAGRDLALMHIHASSMDLHLGNTFKLYEHSTFAVLDPKKPESFIGNMRTITVGEGGSFIVQPGDCSPSRSVVSKT